MHRADDHLKEQDADEESPHLSDPLLDELKVAVPSDADYAALIAAVVAGLENSTFPQTAQYVRQFLTIR